MASRDRGTPRTEGVERAADAIADRALPLDDEAVERLADEVEDADFVLLGEASHGTAEFYRWRARLTAELVERGAASFVGVEGEWTDCFEVNRYVRAERDDPRVTRVLDEFDRWPTWMWANWEAAAFLERLRAHNENRDRSEQVGFYGLDVYGLFEAMESVVEYLEETDYEAAAQARDAYRCFEPYGDDAREYGRSTRLVPENCEDEVVDILAQLRRDARDGAEVGDDSDADPEAHFDAEQSALVAKNAEEYYRTMVRGNDESWNVRDRHMATTLDRLADRFDGTAVVWAHNTHVGDARATDMLDRGRLNLGQLVRERAADDADADVKIVGFGTHRGTVVAAQQWGSDAEEMRVPNARAGSVEDAFHRATAGDCLLLDTDAPALGERRGHRAIGVVYDPDREGYNYVPTNLAERYDAFVHVEETTALHPLGTDADETRQPEAYPWGL